MNNLNSVILNGVIVKIYPIKYTPSGVAIHTFILKHLSNQIDCGVERVVKCRILCILLSSDLLKNDLLVNKTITTEGFLSINAKEQIVLNVQKINIINNY